MKLPDIRARLAAGAGALAMSAGLVLGPATPAHAAPYTPSDADFANCPALPAGAWDLLWNCLAITITGGEIKLGTLTQEITEPVRITVAAGPLNGGLALVSGGIAGEPVPIPPESLPLPIPDLKVRVEQAGDITPAPILPASIPLKIHILSGLVGPDCYIGGAGAPIAVKPNISALGVATLGGVFVLTTTLGDDQFPVPGATGCALGTTDLNPLVNSLVGLPSAAGSNHARFDSAIRVRNYLLGNVTQSFARQHKIT